MRKIKRGLFVTLEGIEGSGKSTQAKMLVSFLKAQGYKVLSLREPGATRLGEGIRGILLNPKSNMSALSETLLYVAARAQLVQEKVIPALRQNKIVICDRFMDATVSYQGYGLGLGSKLIDRMNEIAVKGAVPDLTLLLDLSVTEGLRRCLYAKGFADRIEQRGIAFHSKVRKGYLSQYKRYPKRIKRISVGKNSKEQTQSIIRKIVLDAIKRHKISRSGR